MRSERIEFGDFQTPAGLASEVCRVLRNRGVEPRSVLEPACGRGSLLVAALETLPSIRSAVGLDIKAAHVEEARQTIEHLGHARKVRFMEGDFFQTDWAALARSLPDPVLVLGNPPWVTNAALGRLGSSNLPPKNNARGFRGLDAVTGKSNFDISEWMLTRLLDVCHGRDAVVAMLCKTSVARKVLAHAWAREISLDACEIHVIDARKHFRATASACLLICRLTRGGANRECKVYSGLGGEQADHTLGLRDGLLVADVSAYDRWSTLQGSQAFRWRSGVKHDCVKVMELSRDGLWYRNGYGIRARLEDDYLFPMVKGSDLFRGNTRTPERHMLVTQQRVGEDTGRIASSAPRTWRYLLSYGADLDGRSSVVYRNKPRFSVFGVGEYTFSLWKVGIAGLYKEPIFRSLGPQHGKPVVLDDTCYFLPCRDSDHAHHLEKLLNSDVALEFFSAFIFRDAKRPVTADMLGKLDLLKLAKELGEAPSKWLR
ncbi:MAG: methyltransferase domain-containing protein [Thermodesulfobacteriota bacterium]